MFSEFRFTRPGDDAVTYVIRSVFVCTLYVLHTSAVHCHAARGRDVCGNHDHAVGVQVAAAGDDELIIWR
jgi:hypothetical protein